MFAEAASYDIIVELVGIIWKGGALRRTVAFRVMVAIAIVAIAVLTPPFTAYGQNLQLPARFHGTVEVGCYPMPDGTVIEARIAGDTFYTSTSWAPYGDDDYAMMIIPPEGTSYVSGTPVYFKIGDREATQAGTWEAGGNILLDLTGECTRVTTIVEYMSDAGNPVALSYDGNKYGPYGNAVSTWIWPDYPLIEGATWVSTAYVIEDRWRDSWRKYQRRFDLSIPWNASGISAWLEITADSSYKAYFNGLQIGSDSNLGSVEVWDLTPIDGQNTLSIIVENLGQASGDVRPNPVGVIYKLTASYDAPPSPGLTPTPDFTPIPMVTAAPAPEPTVAPGPGPTASPTVASSPVPTAQPYAAPTRQYVQGYEQSNSQGDAQGGGANMSKVVGVAFFGMLDVVLIGLLVYLVWRFFLHPRVET